MNLFYSSLLALFACTRAVGAANLDPVELGAAGKYALLAGAAITTTAISKVTGDIGVFPGTSFTFGALFEHVGAQHLGDSTAGAAQDDLTVAYNAAAAKTISLGGLLSNQDLGGMTLAPGVYKFDVAASQIGDLTLDAQGDPNAAW
jgi:hypothetical protein